MDGFSSEKKAKTKSLNSIHFPFFAAFGFPFFIPFPSPTVFKTSLKENGSGG